MSTRQRLRSKFNRDRELEGQQNKMSLIEQYMRPNISLNRTPRRRRLRAVRSAPVSLVR